MLLMFYLLFNVCRCFGYRLFWIWCVCLLSGWLFSLLCYLGGLDVCEWLIELLWFGWCFDMLTVVFGWCCVVLCDFWFGHLLIWLIYYVVGELNMFDYALWLDCCYLCFIIDSVYCLFWIRRYCWVCVVVLLTCLFCLCLLFRFIYSCLLFYLFCLLGMLLGAADLRFIWLVCLGFLFEISCVDLGCVSFGLFRCLCCLFALYGYVVTLVFVWFTVVGFVVLLNLIGVT